MGKYRRNKKKGKKKRFGISPLNSLSLLPSGPGEIQEELVVPNRTTKVGKKCALTRSPGPFFDELLLG